ncbi:zinc ribbon domain-containing protein [Planctomycetota bacterium]
MPRYEYVCHVNGEAVEVSHSMSAMIRTWGELCEQAGREPGATPLDAPVQRRIFAPAVRVCRSSAELKNLGFKKLVRRDHGVYENLTADSKESRYVDMTDPKKGLDLSHLD